MKEEVNNFSFNEEIWHWVTHGIGFLLSIVALTLLVTFAYLGNNITTIVSVAIYGTTLMLMYGSSTLYHAITNREAKLLFQKFDHSAIYFLIAGTYTPIVLVTIGGAWGWSIFSIEWGIALVGISLKFLYPNRFEIPSLVAYLVMGWMIVIIFDTFKNNIDPIGFWLMVTGGISYTIGTIFYIKDNISYFHAIWHIFVLTGSILHFLAILLYVV